MMKNPNLYKFLFAGIAVLTIIFMVTNYIYNAIHRDHWLEQDEAIKAAYAQTGLVSVSHVEPFSLAFSYMIVHGKDADGDEMIVWVAMEDDGSEETGTSGSSGNNVSNGAVEIVRNSGNSGNRGSIGARLSQVRGTVTDNVYGGAGQGQGKKPPPTVEDDVYGEQEKEIVIGDLEGVEISPGVRVVHAEYAANGYNKNLLQLKMREVLPDVHIIKMTPGKYDDEWVWEVYYKKSPKEKRTYYDYYRFSDGELLKTLTMSLR